MPANTSTTIRGYPWHPAHPGAGGDHATARSEATLHTVGREQIRFLRSTIRWKFAASAVLDLALAGCAALDNLGLIGATWFVVAMVFQHERDRRMLRTINALDVGRPSSRDVDRLSVYFLVCGALHMLLAWPLLLSSDAQVRTVATLLVCGGSAGVAVLCAGSLRCFFAWSAPVVVSAAASWAWRGGWLDMVVAVLLPIYLVVLGLTVTWHRKLLMAAVKTARCSQARSATFERERDLARKALDQNTQGIAAAVHDLRQPLHALSCQAASLRLARGHGATESLGDLAGGIDRAVLQSLRLIDSMFAPGRGVAPAYQPSAEPLDLVPWCLGVIADHQARAARQGITLRSRLEGGAEAIVRTDPFLLRRIVANLLDNAIKFTTCGFVELQLEPGTKPGQWTIGIEDTGCGFPPGHPEPSAYRPESFNHTSKPRHPRAGTGLGLSTTVALSRSLGSPLQFHSVPGRGTRFWLCLTDLPEACLADLRAPSFPCHPAPQPGGSLQVRP